MILRLLRDSTSCQVCFKLLERPRAIFAMRFTRRFNSNSSTLSIANFLLSSYIFESPYEHRYGSLPNTNITELLFIH